jgi:hypothetical protein
MLCLGYAGWVGRKLQMMTDSMGSTPERLMRASAVGIEAFLIAFLIAYVLRKRIPRGGYWIVAAISGSILFGIGRMTILSVYRDDIGGVLMSLLFHAVLISGPLVGLLVVFRSVRFLFFRWYWDKPQS